jgi:succinate dehydrogenase/fumarate reductase cytochrome b subunit
VILYHTLNGVRVVVIDLGPGVRHQKALFWVVLGLAFVFWVWGSLALLGPMIAGGA